MDYPEAWAFVKDSPPWKHHPKCSYRQTNRALLCDCAYLMDEYERRKRDALT